MEVAFTFPVNEKEEIYLEASSEEILDRFEDEIIFWLEDELSRGGDNNDFYLLLDLCEILEKDFDKLDLKDNELQDCEFLWEEAKKDLLRTVAQEKMIYNYIYSKSRGSSKLRWIEVLCTVEEKAA